MATESSDQEPAPDAQPSARRSPRRGRLAVALWTGGALLGGAALVLLAPRILERWNGDPASTRSVRVPVLEVAFEPEVWRVVQAHPEQPVALGNLTPSSDWRVDGGDLPALLMSPPAEVRFTVPMQPEGLFLRASAGVDHLVGKRLENMGLEAEVGFEIEVAGERVLEASVELGAAEQELTWMRLPTEGVSVPPGSEVVLRTTLGATDPQTHDQLPPLRAGFGALVLEREVERSATLATPQTPNVLLIVMDTQRADRMSCYGYSIETTPNADALAARGLLFEEAYATSSWTWPATASILTGLIPEAHQVLHEASCYLDGRFVTVAEVLAERGYRTAAFSCNPLIVPNKNFDQGFEHFDSGDVFRKTDVILEDVQAWLRRHHDERFFLYLHLVDPHWDYQPLPESIELAGLGDPPPDFPEGGIVHYQMELMRGHGHGPAGELLTDQVVPAAHREHMQRSYDAVVHTGDVYLGRILDTLTELGLDDRTVIAYTSDHGEEILDHGLATHGLTLHRELTRVPLILAGPSIPAGQRVGTRVSNRHLAPTIAMLAGGELPELEVDAGDFPDHPRMGQPVLLLDPDGIHEEPIFFSTAQGWWKGQVRTPLYGMIEGDWEVHYASGGRPYGASEEWTGGDFALYHLPTDPLQHEDLSGEHAERGREMIERLMSHHRKVHSQGRDLRLGAGSAALEYLMAIGYLGATSGEDDGACEHGAGPAVEEAPAAPVEDS